MTNNSIASLMRSVKKSSLVLSIATILLSASCVKNDTNTVTPDPADTTTNNPPVLADTVSTYSGRVELAYLQSTNADPKCFINLANGKVYKVSEGKDHATEIDILWGTRTVTPSQKYFISISESQMLNAIGANPDLWRESNLFTGWSKRNVSMMDYFNATGFNSINTRGQLMEYIGNNTGILTYVPFEGTADHMSWSYSYDITHNGAKYVGVMKITQADMADEYADFTIKVVRIL